VTSPPIARFPGDYRQIISRVPAKLDMTLMKEPQVVRGLPRSRGELKPKKRQMLAGFGLAI